jgi:hypothetical protein
MATGEDVMTVEQDGEPRNSGMQELSAEERNSLTHGDFWIPESEREVYKRALRALNSAGVPYVVAGMYAVFEHTGIYRQSKDLDVFVEPIHVIGAMRTLKDAGFRACLTQGHWLAKAFDGEHFVDVIFGMGNGLALIDQDWYRYSRPAILAATPVRIAPPEELLWHRLFISERHRHDMADIAHLLLTVGASLNWKRLLAKTGEHWPLLLAQLLMFAYVYPESTGAVPRWVMEELLARSQIDIQRDRSDEPVTRGTLVSRFSFAIDVNEWRYRDLREEYVRAVERTPIVREIVASDVWDERGPQISERFGERAD